MLPEESVAPMTLYTARPEARSYGHAIGIIVLDCVQPNIPGDVANASTYRYPVLFEAAPGLTPTAAKTGDPAHLGAAVEAARRLEGKGVKAIASNCGFLLYIQDEVAAAVRVPVLMSSLLQLPLIFAFLAGDRAVGVITADDRLMTAALLERAAGAEAHRLRIVGLQDGPEFTRGILEQAGSLDAERLSNEVVATATALVDRHPGIGALLLECALLPPYSRAVQRATGLPVYDFVTQIDWLFRGTHQQVYEGLY